jgi:hypothetical protein
MQMLEGGFMGELFKMHSLMQHYKEHKAVDSSVSFFDFVVMHYININAHEGNHNHKMKLPFHDLSAIVHLHIVIPNLSIESTKAPLSSIALIQCSPFKVGEVNSFNGDVWLPPKL